VFLGAGHKVGAVSLTSRNVVRKKLNPIYLVLRPVAPLSA
jgi:hypothetical protein